ncbi:hypothetical protein [Streptomyces sp. NBC_01190]|uniref:hypothetical protein n=1 Tax=Streptomyces sp. NBC_01190 TaxID=2903767 RepID=UPI0038641695|nr:hypothetical protein OG519_13630 [Streptomyces sp. NBC_01190]
MTALTRLREEDLKYLELLQTVIARHGNNSFLVKSWAVTLNAAFIVVTDRRQSWRGVMISLSLAAGFWLLDSYYLRQERLFRTLYDRFVVQGPAGPPLFTMDAARYGDRVGWRSVALSRTMLCTYGLLVAVDMVVVLLA